MENKAVIYGIKYKQLERHLAWKLMKMIPRQKNISNSAFHPLRHAP
jgi:hypothetical protein